MEGGGGRSDGTAVCGRKLTNRPRLSLSKIAGGAPPAPLDPPLYTSPLRSRPLLTLSNVRVISKLRQIYNLLWTFLGSGMYSLLSIDVLSIDESHGLA